MKQKILDNYYEKAYKKSNKDWKKFANKFLKLIIGKK